MTPAQRDLVEANVGFASWIARRHGRSPEVRDELVGEALLALALAAVRFDPTRGSSFHAFAKPTIRGMVLTALERMRRAWSREVSIEEPIAHGRVDAPTIGDTLTAPGPSPADIVTLRDAAACLRAALRTLPRRQRQVLERRYLGTHERTLAEAGAIAGRGPETTRVHERRALERMRRTLGSLR